MEGEDEQQGEDVDERGKEGKEGEKGGGEEGRVREERDDEQTVDTPRGTNDVVMMS